MAGSSSRRARERENQGKSHGLGTYLMVFDLSSFEGGGELETREQDLASHHQAKNSVARGGLPARDITALARYLRETWNQPLPASFCLYLPADGGPAMYRANQAARSAGSKSLLQGSSRAYRLPVWSLQTQLGSIISSGLFSVLRSASRDAAQAVPSRLLEAGGCMYVQPLQCRAAASAQEQCLRAQPMCGERAATAPPIV
ncbi:hypothetical protein THAR02_05273 [Trichoderma harzianum]|uniref:Uncharacterized protein n=1 Tax=Trichoderma harzianum TaxID=5544 RepID=A0A0G0ACB9_TRIHA|nr:hypothetical protein THAR02_05273 [Trichoderma harzianum]